MGLFDRLQTEIERREEQVGISPADLLDMSPELQRLVRTMSRQGALTLEEVCAHVSLSSAEARQLLEGLVAKGHARTEESDGVVRYRVFFGRRRAREVPLDIWQALAERTQDEAEDQ